MVRAALDLGSAKNRGIGGGADLSSALIGLTDRSASLIGREGIAVVQLQRTIRKSDLLSSLNYYEQRQGEHIRHVRDHEANMAFLCCVSPVKRVHFVSGG